MDRESAVITVNAIFSELRTIEKSVGSVRQTLDETVKPTLLDHDQRLDKHADTLLALNIKFYGIVGGLGIAGVTVVAQVFGWL